jgi:hypothetical protein
MRTLMPFYFFHGFIRSHIITMTSKEANDIQLSLLASLSALSLHKDLGISDNTLSLSSSLTTLSSGRAQSPQTHNLQEGIPLHLADWRKHDETPLASPDEARSRARSIFMYFVNAGKEFGLEGTPCVKMLEEAISICDKASDPKYAASLTGAKKVVQQTSKTAPMYAATLGSFVLERIPVFNIFEAMCWIYTCCVMADDVLTDRDAELYLYQLLLIFDTLKETKWIPTTLVPSTIAAAWSEPSGNSQLTIAFACSCATNRDKLRVEMNAARREYVKRLHNLVNIHSSSESCPNKPGNCPEFVVWGALCQGRGTYRTLCLNIPSKFSYKCCTHCESLAKAAWEQSEIKIEDWYEKTSLRAAPSTKKKGYEGCLLKSTKEIIKDGRGRKVPRRR